MSGAVQGETLRLLAWYDANRRILPWREDPTPYHVWLSEIMLQQTRVEAVKKYYARFIERLPDIRALSEADEDTCSKLWEGLGYYSRVRNLRKAAIVIEREYGGVMPGTRKNLAKLPGIGAYTSAAIASIAFGEPVPAVDGNLQRIFARRTACEEEIGTPAVRDAAEVFFQERIPDNRPGDYNQALMDLGAMICLPNGAPKCTDCPWEGDCLARREGREKALPVPKKKKEKRVEELTVLLVRTKDMVLIRKREETGLLAGLFEFPNETGHLTEQEAEALLLQEGLLPLSVRELPPARHVFTHLVWEMTGYEIWVREPREGDPCLPEGEKFVSLPEAAAVCSIPSAFAVYKKILYQRKSATEPSAPREGAGRRARRSPGPDRKG